MSALTQIFYAIYGTPAIDQISLACLRRGDTGPFGSNTSVISSDCAAARRHATVVLILRD